MSTAAADSGTGEMGGAVRAGRGRLRALALVAAGLVVLVGGVLGLVTAVAALLGPRAGPLLVPLGAGASAPVALAIVLILRWRGWLASPPEPARPARAVRVVLLGAVGLVIGVAVISIVYRLLGMQPAERPELLEVVRALPPWLVYATLGVLGPVGEELFFRRFVFTTMRGPFSRGTAHVSTALLFALLHANLGALAIYFFIGIVLSFVYERTGRLVVPIAVHAANNLLVSAVHLSAPAAL